MRDRLLNAALAFFALGSFSMYYLAVPLFALELDASPFLIGIAVGIRPLLPALLSIHGGALMDRLGVRQVLIVTGTLGVLTPLLIPLVPNIWALILLQLVGGLAEGLAWLGAQTRLAQVSQGNADAAGWFATAGKIGMTFSPLIAGFMWDRVGAVACFWFIALWSAGFLVTVLLLPRLNASGKANTGQTTLADLMPRWDDYRKAFALLAIPMIAIVCITTFLRLATFGIQSSFYPVYLESVEITGTMIGALIGFASLMAVPAAMLAGPLARRFSNLKVTLVAVVFSVVGITMPPFLPGTVGLFFLAALFGIGNGVTLPLMLAALSKSTPEGDQGISTGLRATVNRLGNIVIPVMMGAIVQLYDLTTSFMAMAVILLLATLVMAIVASRKNLINE